MFCERYKTMSEKLGQLVKPKILALHCDNHHDGDEVKRFAFKDEMGKITLVLEVGSVYLVEYDPPLETASDKKIVKAKGVLGEVQGYFGLKLAKIWYEDDSTVDKDMILGLIVGMKLKKLNA